MKINLRQFASYAARQFAGRSGACCGTPGIKRLLYGAEDEPPVPPVVTYYILAETGDILNAENNDKLRTETP